MAPTGSSVENKKNNVLPVWGNEKTMNLNNLILTNIQSSHYFKVNLYKLKTYHEVIDEIYYSVNHLEPWEKGSRRTSGQTGMCGGVRGVGAGGIVSTAFCILYKLYTLKLTRKQLVGLMHHKDSGYIRALGFMYIRYTQPPADLWTWFEPYLEDDEEVDPKAGGGQSMTIGQMVRHLLTKLEWFSSLFPRIPVPIQKDIESKLTTYQSTQTQEEYTEAEAVAPAEEEPQNYNNHNNNNRRRESPPERSHHHHHHHRRNRDDYAEELQREKDRQKKEHSSSSKGNHRRDNDDHSSKRERHHKHKERHRSRSPHNSRHHKSGDKHRYRSPPRRH